MPSFLFSRQPWIQEGRKLNTHHTRLKMYIQGFFKLSIFKAKCHWYEHICSVKFLTLYCVVKRNYGEKNPTLKVSPDTCQFCLLPPLNEICSHSPQKIYYLTYFFMHSFFSFNQWCSGPCSLFSCPEETLLYRQWHIRLLFLVYPKIHQ